MKNMKSSWASFLAVMVYCFFVVGLISSLVKTPVIQKLQASKPDKERLVGAILDPAYGQKSPE